MFAMYAAMLNYIGMKQPCKTMAYDTVFSNVLSPRTCCRKSSSISDLGVQSIIWFSNALGAHLLMSMQLLSFLCDDLFEIYLSLTQTQNQLL